MAQKRIVALVADGMAPAELMAPLATLLRAGATVTVVSPSGGAIRAINDDPGAACSGADRACATKKPEEFDALLLSGGVTRPDDPQAAKDIVAFVRCFTRHGKLIAAIGKAPWVLIEAGAIKGRRLTSWPSLRADFSKAGAIWLDQPVVQDGALVTAQKYEDIALFSETFAALLKACSGPCRRAA